MNPARLGELERHLGDGVIEAVVDAELGKGRLKRRQRRGLMSYPLVIRLMIAAGLMPEASYCEALARVAGLLADVPFALQWHVPTGKVVTNWRRLIPADVMEAVFWHAAGPLISDDEPSAVLQAGRMVLAADGMPVNLADTAAIAALHTLNVPGRQRHSRRAQKARPEFPHATATKTTATSKPQVTAFALGLC
jgi:hypothetical protein